MNTWNDLSLSEKSEMMRVAIENGITTLPEIRKAYNQFAEGGDTVGEWVDAIYQNNPQEEFLGEPSHHYDFTQSEEWANAYGYYPDARGHRDDRVKKPAHPSHPSRGTWDGNKFVLSELGMQNPNYTLFGLNDGGQDPQAVLTYQGGSVIPEITATPNGNYFFNPYDNIKLKFAEGGNLFSGTENHSSQMHQGYVYDVLPKMLKEAGLNVRVTSGYRRPGQAGKAGNRSWHVHHGAVDIVPQGKTTFEDIENALYNNPVISRYMIDNGFGLIDESGRTAESKVTMKKTGATGAHFHIGKDSKAVSAYNNKMSSIWNNNMSQLETAINQPTLPIFMPSNPQAFFAPLESYQRPVVVEEPLVQAAMENPYSPEQLEREERAQGLRNLGLAMSIMRGGQEQSYSPLWSAVSMLSGNQMAKGGKIHIKPSHRDRLTELKKRTGKTEAELYKNGSAATRKMITFARNARKWKHGLGGNLFSGEDTPTQQMNSGLNLYRNTNKAGDVWYTYQETPDSEEILLTPTNKRFSDDPSIIKAIKDATRKKKEINEPYWNEQEHIDLFMNEENPIEREFQKHLYDANEPLSVDSYKTILQEATKDNSRFALRYDSSPMGMFNPQGVYEEEFYNSLQSLTPKEQVNAINRWMKSYYPKARPAYLKNGEVMIPRPLLMYKGKK